jgi:hypothetical protein
LSSKEGAFSKERGHDSREKNSVSFWLKYFFVVGGRIVWIHIVCMILYISYKFWHRNRGILGTVFEVEFIIFVAIYGSYKTVRENDCGHIKRGTKEAVQ